MFTFLIVGCQSPPQCDNHCQVDAELTQRMGQSLGPSKCPDETMLPPHVDLADGVTEEEAIAVAVWNNAVYQELLSQLGISRAQLFDAGLLTDPQLTLFFPLGPKQLEYTLFQSIDAIWLRPIRIRAAELDLCQLSDQMVQNGLNLIRDVRLAHAQLVFAQSQADLAAEARELQTAIADLALKRLQAGDISELESMNSQIDELQAEVDSNRFERDVTLARERLRVLMGIGMYDDALVAIEAKLPGSFSNEPENYVSQALAMRPDLRAAEINFQAACERSKLAEFQFMNLEVAYDANSRGLQGYESGPGLRMTLPIFNRNRGGIAIADAQVQQAFSQYVTIRDQITLDVRNAHTQWIQAAENLTTLQQKILPSLETSLDVAQKGFQGGGSDYFIVLLTTQRFVQARTQELRLKADIRQAIAELDRSVGHRVESSIELDPLVPTQPNLLPAPESASREIVPAQFHTALPTPSENNRLPAAQPRSSRKHSTSGSDLILYE